MLNRIDFGRLRYNREKYGLTASTTATRVTAVSVDEVRCRARLTEGDHDELLRQFIEEATDQLENETSRAFVNRQYTMKLDHFPLNNEPIRLPVAPVQSVASIVYTDDSGNDVTWSSSLYDVDTTEEPGRVRPAYDQDYPDTRSTEEMGSVTVTFTAGYGATQSTVPPLARKAIANAAVAEFDGCGAEKMQAESWRNAVGLLKWSL